jgi:peptide/nickel transport system substrate-binding protein
MGDDGKWQFDGQPVHALAFLIRTEDERRQIGDYVANQLETVGFTVDRQYKTRSEASPLWVQSDPTEGLWDIYTGGWIYNFVDRDEGDSFSFYYTPNDYPIPLFQAYTPSEEFNTVALQLRNNDFASLEERDQIFPEALRMSIQDSARIWVNDSASFSPFRKGLVAGYDLGAGIAGAQVWPFTIRWEGQEGGIAKIAQPGILVDPWNPLGGSNWVYDAMPQRATTDYAALLDPYTGLAWPQRLESADMVVKEGLPVNKTLDWVNLSFEPEITVPEDAWADWDATTQTFITVGEKYTETVTANTKYVVHYPADMFEMVKWHDGSPISVGDFVMFMIQYFDQGKEESAIYDPAAAEALAAFQDHFKGVKIVSTDPLVIETYSDQYSLDAEVPFGTLNWTTWYPGFYAFGSAGWHNLMPAILAEANGELAFSSAKADEAGVEWTGFLSGPSLEIQKKYLDQLVASNSLPYSPTLGEYISADEVAARYAALNDWYNRKGHFWLGTGPYYVDQVFPVEGTLTLRRFQDYPDLANRWSQFGVAKIAEVDVSGPGNVTIGEEAAFDVTVTFQGEPYPADEISSVQWLVFDATGALAAQGEAEAAGDGAYTVTLPADVTSALQAGSNRLQVAVASSVVAIPTFGTYEFVTAP